MTQGRVVAVAGASGGTKIITAVAQVLFRAFYLGQVTGTFIRCNKSSLEL